MLGGDLRRLWRRAKRSLSLCGRPWDAADDAAVPPPRSSSSFSSPLFSEGICAICFKPLRRGGGHAIFTAECSHAFHFHCVSASAAHACPVCRAKWKHLPAARSSSTALRPSKPAPAAPRIRRARSDIQTTARAVVRATDLYDDDEPVQTEVVAAAADGGGADGARTVRIQSFPEFSSVQESESREEFAVLIHLKAPSSKSGGSRAPVDIVTVLDVSGSMAGTKLALLKRAMGFVIHSLGPLDRLSVIVFSSTARRLFPLRRMSEFGRQQSLHAVNMLFSGGGTNIPEALRKGAKILEERQHRNPVAGVILLSDGKDTFAPPSKAKAVHQYYRALVPASLKGESIPVHTFGFGADHDPDALSAIAEASSGTFSFIEDEGVIQDALAQCIGGLLSVVVQDMQLSACCADPAVRISSVKAGSYTFELAGDGRSGTIQAGSLYADEERDFLLSVKVPPAPDRTVLLDVSCVYRDPVTDGIVKLQGEDVSIRRPAVGSAEEAVSIEVDRERSRRQAAESMVLARSAADRGALPEAVSILEERRRILNESFASRAGDRLCLALDAELREMQERMASRQRYETSGRAYMLSGLSSHSWQRATARGDSTETTTAIYSYQTPSMVDMVGRSQCISPR